MKNSPIGIAAIIIITFCNLVFADTVYLKNGSNIENVTIAEITPTDIKYKIGERAVLYTIPKDDATKIVYKDGSEDVFTFEPQVKAPKDSVVKRTILLNIGYLRGLEMSSVAETTKNFKYLENDFIISYGPGLGIYWSGADFISFPAFLNVHLGLQKDNYEYFLDNRLGANLFGDQCDFGTCDVFYEPSVGVQYNNFNLSLGYNFSSEFENSFVIRAGYRHHYETTVQIEDDSDDAPKEKEKEKNSRYFRPGIEFNYPVYRSKIEFFDNSFPYLAGGAGLFFRIGPEYFYFTTGAYAKVEGLYKEGFVSKDFGIFGINLGSVDFLDLEWNRLFVEVPLLLSFGSGQIRFTGGTLLDFYALSEININVNKKLGGKTIISANDAKKIEERFNEIPSGNIYAVFGLDIDIVRHWGVGVKCLVWGSSLGESDSDLDYKIDMGIEPSRFQTRVSTYFVF